MAIARLTSITAQPEVVDARPTPSTHDVMFCAEEASRRVRRALRPKRSPPENMIMIGALFLQGPVDVTRSRTAMTRRCRLGWVAERPNENVGPGLGVLTPPLPQTFSFHARSENTPSGAHLWAHRRVDPLRHGLGLLDIMGATDSSRLLFTTLGSCLRNSTFAQSDGRSSLLAI
jgi:hypothetical protein